MIFPIILRGNMRLAGLMDSQSRQPNAARGFDFMKSGFWCRVNRDGILTTAPQSFRCGVDAEDFRVKRIKMHNICG